MVTGYCVRCKKKVAISEAKVVTKSGRKMTQGTCPKCKTKVTRFGG